MDPRKRPSAQLRRLGLELLEDRRLLDGAIGQQAIELFDTSPAPFVENQGQCAQDTAGPRVVDQLPDELQSDGGPLSAIRLTFDEPIDPDSFTDADVVLKDPQGFQITPLAVGPVAGSSNTQFDVTFPDQDLRGKYRLSVGPEITDERVALYRVAARPLLPHTLHGNGGFVRI